MGGKTLIQNKLLYPEILWELPQNVYKRQRGKILIIAGAKGYTGAPVLCLEAAFRAGAGLVTLAFPDAILDIYKRIVPSAMSLALPSTKSGSLSLAAKNELLKLGSDSDVVALGPGLSVNSETVQLVWELIFETKKPIVLDADGINALSVGLTVIKEKEGQAVAEEYLLKRKELTIITPHAAEATRLVKALRGKGEYSKITPEYVDVNKKEIADYLAAKTGFVVVLKGHESIVCSASKCVINKTGNPGMATAGTGDVLTGIITTLVAQNLKKPFAAACVGVYLHGLAGDLAAEKIGKRSIIASDLIKYLPEAIRKAEGETGS